MMKPNTLIIVMMMILMINLMTTKTSIMCINMIMFIMSMSIIISMKIMMSPIPFITFLTMIGGLMIMFLYLASTLWMKKEILTLKTKSILILNTLAPLMVIKSTYAHPISPSILMFSNNFNMMTITLIYMLNIMLMFTIEIHMKMNNHFRQKLKMWG